MPSPSATTPNTTTAFTGLAPYLRMSIAGADVAPVAQQMLALAQTQPEDANLWMNLSIVLQCLGQRELGLSMQTQALSLQRVYYLAARQQPARCRLLMLMEPGDLAANTPLDCLLEDSDVDLILYYLSADAPLQVPLPEHDVVLVAMSDSDANRAHLQFLEQALARWPQPVINLPRFIPYIDRGTASERLQNIPGLLMPPTLRATRTQMQAVANGTSLLRNLFDDCDSASSDTAATTASRASSTTAMPMVISAKSGSRSSTASPMRATWPSPKTG